MYETIDYEEALKIEDKKIFVDVRSPSEYKKFTIPGAINIPILSDEERVIVGTLYDSGKYDEAKQKGVEFVSKKLPDVFAEFLKLNKEYKYVFLFCARGGYRSASFAGFLHSLGLRVFKINGGYKKYRSFVTETINKAIDEVEFIMLYGNTGTGKTKILKEIKDLGYDILDLEKYANHMGSLLGSVGLGECNSQKMFESLMAEDLLNRKTNVFFVEGESRRIGKIIIQQNVYDKMVSSKKVKIDAEMDYRIENIKEDYVIGKDDELKDAINNLRKYISNTKADEYNRKIDNGEYDDVIRDICINYYDPMYESNKREFVKTYLNKNNREIAKQLISDFAPSLEGESSNDEVKAED